ncbi:MAG: preprotein translocase subunit SecG [Bacteroidales bacterium]|nr:preprotein translocase subunit SecG [Bacteroidales bacterium]
MYSVFVILAVIVAVLLALIVLIQESKGGGLASSFASSNQIMGVRKTTDVVEKATWTLAALLVVFSVFSAFCLSEPTQVSVTNDFKATQTQPVSQGAGAAATGQNSQAQQ